MGVLPQGAWRFKSPACAEAYFGAGHAAFRMEAMLVHPETHKGEGEKGQAGGREGGTATCYHPPHPTPLRPNLTSCPVLSHHARAPKQTKQPTKYHSGHAPALGGARLPPALPRGRRRPRPAPR